MARCIDLAKLGLGKVSPNPMVGAVLVYQDKIIGEGYHEWYGKEHAEVNCVHSVSTSNRKLIPESTLYVSLEPCSHFGRTPPCTNLIRKENIQQVVIGCRDPFAQVNGKGVQILRENGIEVKEGVLRKQCVELNKRFFTFLEKNRPFVILKWAQSVDGKMGKLGERTPISNKFIQKIVHKWRSEEDAILVGTKTLTTDDPELTNRLWSGKNPLRLIIDKEDIAEHNLKIFNDQVRTVIFNTKKDEEDGHIQYVKLSGENFLPEILSFLHGIGVQSVIIEGGPKTLKSFIDSAEWDEARVITNPNLAIGEGTDAPPIKNFQMRNIEELGGNTITYYCQNTS